MWWLPCCSNCTAAGDHPDRGDSQRGTGRPVPLAVRIAKCEPPPCWRVTSSGIGARTWRCCWASPPRRVCWAARCWWAIRCAPACATWCWRGSAIPITSSRATAFSARIWPRRSARRPAPPSLPSTAWSRTSQRPPSAGRADLRSRPALRRGAAGQQILLSAALAANWAPKPGDTLLVRVEKPSAIPLESLHGRKEDVGKTIRLTLGPRAARVLAESATGRCARRLRAARACRRNWARSARSTPSWWRGDRSLTLAAR
jgi:hypothetical protein